MKTNTQEKWTFLFMSMIDVLLCVYAYALQVRVLRHKSLFVHMHVNMCAAVKAEVVHGRIRVAT